MAPARVPPWTTARETIRAARRVATLAAVVLLIVTGTSTAARAQPSLKEIEAQINQMWNTLEPLIEQYNVVHAQLQQNKAKAEALAVQMRPLQLKIDLTLTRVGAMSATLYRYGPALKLNALLSTNGPTDLADQLSAIQAIARRQAAKVDDAADLVAQYDAQKRPLDALIATQSKQDADLATKKTSILKQMTQLQALRQQAYGSSGKAGGAIRPVACPYVLGTGKGAIAAKKACDQIGKPYVWAAAGPSSFDCSGLTLYAWAAAGVRLRHYTKWQWQDTTPVSRANLRPGDLVFYFNDLHHMGMYVGGDWVVHAPTTGDVVRMTKLDNPYLPIAGYRRPG